MKLLEHHENYIFSARFIMENHNKSSEDSARYIANLFNFTDGYGSVDDQEKIREAIFNTILKALNNEEELIYIKDSYENREFDPICQSCININRRECLS